MTKKRKLEYIKIEKIEKALEDCRKNHNSIETGTCKSKEEHCLDSGAWSVINYIQGVIDKDKAERMGE